MPTAIIDPSRPTCRSCKFFDWDGKAQTGDCHRFPPTAQFLGDGMRVTFYPSPNPGMWCAEHVTRISMAPGAALGPGDRNDKVHDGDTEPIKPRGIIQP